MAASHQDQDPESSRARTGSMAALFTGVALSATGFVALVTVTPLVAEDLLGGPTWSGLPSALGIMGTAFGTSWLSGIMTRHGRRRGLLSGYALATIAAMAATVAAQLGIFALLLVSIFALGWGHGANRLSRYAAADMYAADKRASAIGWTVWAATIGSVLGPMMLEPMRRLSEGLGQTNTTGGPYLIASMTFLGAALVIWLFFRKHEAHLAPATSVAAPWAGLSALKRPRAGVALAALTAGQVVMVLIMTMTPVHIRGEGRGLASIGAVIAAHTFGMYALSPLSGFLSDRLGRTTMIPAAGALLCTAGLIAAQAAGRHSWLLLALFLLGLGWNFGYVAGSALLTESVPEDVRVRLQGSVDSLVWGSAAVASLLSGVLLSSVGYGKLSLIGAGLALAPTILLALRYPSFSARTDAG